MANYTGRMGYPIQPLYYPFRDIIKVTKMFDTPVVRSSNISTVGYPIQPNFYPFVDYVKFSHQWPSPIHRSDYISTVGYPIQPNLYPFVDYVDIILVPPAGMQRGYSTNPSNFNVRGIGVRGDYDRIAFSSSSSSSSSSS